MAPHTHRQQLKLGDRFSRPCWQWSPDNTFAENEHYLKYHKDRGRRWGHSVIDVKYEDGFGSKNEDGIVRFWMGDEWQRFPKELWAWEFFPVAVVYGRYVPRLWAPKVRRLHLIKSQGR